VVTLAMRRPPSQACGKAEKDIEEWHEAIGSDRRAKARAFLCTVRGVMSAIDRHVGGVRCTEKAYALGTRSAD